MVNNSKLAEIVASFHQAIRSSMLHNASSNYAIGDMEYAAKFSSKDTGAIVDCQSVGSYDSGCTLVNGRAAIMPLVSVLQYGQCEIDNTSIGYVLYCYPTIADLAIETAAKEGILEYMGYPTCDTENVE